MKALLFFIALLISGNGFSQESSVYGKITDSKTGEDLLYADISIYQKGKLITTGTTDFEGNYSIIIDSGDYDIHISYEHYHTYLVKDVFIVKGQASKLDLKIKSINDKDSNKDIIKIYYTDIVKEEYLKRQHSYYSNRPYNTVWASRFICKINLSEKRVYSSYPTYNQRRINIDKGSSIYGQVVDLDDRQGIAYASISLFYKNRFWGPITKGRTDFNGNYKFDVEPGSYEIIVSYHGYEEIIIQKIYILHGQNRKLDIPIQVRPMIFNCGIFYYKIPLIDFHALSSGRTIGSKQIRNQTTKDVNELSFITPGVSIGRF